MREEPTFSVTTSEVAWPPSAVSSQPTNDPSSSSPNLATVPALGRALSTAAASTEADCALARVGTAAFAATAAAVKLPIVFKKSLRWLFMTSLPFGKSRGRLSEGGGSHALLRSGKTNTRAGVRGEYN